MKKVKKNDKNDKKQFEEPKMEIIEIEKEDIITNSNGNEYEDPEEKEI